MMKKIIPSLHAASALAWIWILFLPGFSAANGIPRIHSYSQISGQLTGILLSRNPSGEKTLYIKLQTIEDQMGPSSASREILLENEGMIRLIEDAHFLLMEDFIENDLSCRNIHVRFFGVDTERRRINGRAYDVILSAEAINPDTLHSKSKRDSAEIEPTCPKPDFFHRYIDVPFSYRHPERGTFRLYYEVNSDFDPAKPTVIIPTDGQRSSSLIGWADRYKEIFNLSFNIVTHEYRGMPCARIHEIGESRINWKIAYEDLNTDNAVEDIEQIRKHLLGDRKALLLGGSGTAMMGLKYLAKYHRHIKRAYLMSFFKDAETSSRSGLEFFDSFLKQHNLGKAFGDVIDRKDVSPEQFLFLVQRLLYFDQNKTRELIEKTSCGDMSLLSEWTRKLGTVDYFIRSVQKYRPWTVVFMYETNIEPPVPGKPDINYPFFAMAEPLNMLASQGRIPLNRFDVKDIENISTEILLVGGTLDQVAPLSGIEAVHKLLPNSRLAVFEAYHCLQVIPEAKQCRNEIIDVFFRHGHSSGDLSEVLHKAGTKSRFLEMR